MHVIDASAWDKVRGSAAGGRAGELAYVVVADTLEPRIAACLAALKPYNLGVLVARNGEEALGLVRRFGAPILLVVDLSLPAPDGFAVIDAVRQGGRTEIIAWSSVRGLREFAVHRLGADHVRVLSGGVAPAVVNRAIERALRDRVGAETAPRKTDTFEDIMNALATKARALCKTAGAAVFLRPSAEAEFQTAAQWDSEEPIPYSPADLPRVFNWISKTGEALVLPDLSRQRTGVAKLRLRDSLRGLVAVPAVDAEQRTIGMLCVFDITPFRFDDTDIDALKALGRGISMGDAAPAPLEVPPRGPREPVPAAPAAVIVEAPAALVPSDSSTALAVLDRRDGNLAIARELARVRREQRHLSVILFDVDSMTVASESPRESLDLIGTVAETLAGAVRGSDLAIRWSREELLVVLAGLNAAEARRVAERVRAAMQAGARYPVAVSGGVAELLAEDTFESVMARANQQARLAKARGHNRVS